MSGLQLSRSVNAQASLLWALAPLFALVLVLTGCISASAPDTAISDEPDITEVSIGARSMSVWSWQARGEPRGTILFSHGAASSPWKYVPLIERWRDEGYAVHAPLHVDSEDHPDKDAFAGMASWRARLEDFAALADRFGTDGYVAAGHSYGALLALVKGGSGASVPEGFNGPLADPRVSLVLAFSPPPAIPMLVSESDYARLATPSLVQTGTLDNPPFGERNTWHSHLDAYHAAAADGHHYALVLEGVDHYFGGAICRLDAEGPPQRAALAEAEDVSALMLAAYDRGQRDAHVKLNALTIDTGEIGLRRK